MLFEIQGNFFQSFLEYIWNPNLCNLYSLYMYEQKYIVGNKPIQTLFKANFSRSDPLHCLGSPSFWNSFFFHLIKTQQGERLCVVVFAIGNLAIGFGKKCFFHVFFNGKFWIVSFLAYPHSQVFLANPELISRLQIPNLQTKTLPVPSSTSWGNMFSLPQKKRYSHGMALFLCTTTNTVSS